MAKSLRIALIIVEITSLPLLLLLLLYILSGYQMLLRSPVFFPRAETIHKDPLLRILLILLVYLHSSAGLILLINRRIRNKIVKNILEYTVILLTSLFLAFCIILELLLRRYI